MTAVVNLSSVSARHTAAFAAASTIMSGGETAMGPAPTPMYLATTGRRLFIFRAHPTFVRPEEHLMTTPRAGPEIKERLLNSSFTVSLPDDEWGLKIVPPLIGRRIARR
ncbi:hypothetical protein GCM10010266_69050 [Streptomyces griseomycini]|nr:hypothetical protein GCM10010266_69050 [Streptomyces griseomycini]